MRVKVIDPNDLILLATIINANRIKMKTVKIIFLLLFGVQMVKAQIGTIDAINGVILGNNTGTTNGTIRYNGSDFEGRKSGIWTSLTDSGSSSVWSLSGLDAYYNTGNVCIGLSNPLDKLHIDGDIRLEGPQYLEWYEGATRKAYVRYSGTDMFINNSETSGSIEIDAEDDFVVQTGTSGLTRFAITDSGRVGIGTAGPASLLHVLGDGSTSTTATLTTSNLAADENTLKLFNVTSNANSQFLECSNGLDNVFSLDTDGELRMFETGGGRSIEMRANDSSLSLGRNAVNYEESGALYFDEDLDIATLCGMGLQYDGNDNNLYMVGGCNAGIDTLATFSRDGEWAIGTMAPATGYLVSVAGKIICEELQVELEGTWPDYVFDNKYELMSLDELQEYISVENHLPNIPAAKEIEANGIPVGEMQKKMMEKIEELTLYILQLKEEIDSLKDDKNSEH
jgi:hypothetical protein